MTQFVYCALLLVASPVSVKIKGLPLGWKVTAHLMRGDEVAASGMAFADAREDDQVVAYASDKKDAVAMVGSPRDTAADGTLTLEFPDRVTLQGEVRFVDGPALEGLLGNAGRSAPFAGQAATRTFEQLGASKLKIENGHFSVSVPVRAAGEVRIGAPYSCIAEKYVPAVHPSVSLSLPVGMLEGRVEDEKGKPIKVFNALAAGVVLGGRAGSFKHAVLATCDLQLEITAKGYAPQWVPFKVERGATVKLATIVMRHK